MMEKSSKKVRIEWNDGGRGGGGVLLAGWNQDFSNRKFSVSTEVKSERIIIKYAEKIFINFSFMSLISGNCHCENGWKTYCHSFARTVLKGQIPKNFSTTEELKRSGERRDRKNKRKKKFFFNLSFRELENH